MENGGERLQLYEFPNVLRLNFFYTTACYQQVILSNLQENEVGVKGRKL